MGAAAGLGSGPKSQKQQNEEFFASRGEANAGRPDGVRPSEGGKYAGFGSGFTPEPHRQGAAAGGGAAAAAPPALNEFQQDPLGALGKGLGWFGGVVGKAGKSVNDGWIQPTAQKVCHFQLF